MLQSKRVLYQPLRHFPSSRSSGASSLLSCHSVAWRGSNGGDTQKVSSGDGDGFLEMVRRCPAAGTCNIINNILTNLFAQDDSIESEELPYWSFPPHSNAGFNSQ